MTCNLHHVHTAQLEPKYALFATSWAVGTVLILIAIKVFAYIQSGSVAILATLADSVIDGGISLLMFFAVRFSQKPADDDHRYGHGKIEGIAALFQAAMMSGAALFLIFESAQRFIDPKVIEEHQLGVGVAAIAIVLSGLLVVVQDYCLKKAPSLAVEADKAHYTTDIFLNGSVIAVLLFHYYGGPIWVDPVAGLCVSSFFGWTAYHIGKKAVDMLMDKELPDPVREDIQNTALQNDQVHGIHDLRTRAIGMRIRISFDLEIDADLLLKDAHAITLDVERAILQKYPHAEIMIHLDPHGIPHHDSRHDMSEEKRDAANA